MSGKAAGAYLTISEVSEKLDVPSHVLRFWETKFTQLKPLKRSGGRRYYRDADIELLTRIRHLLYKDGFTIKGAQKALKSLEAQPVVKNADSPMPVSNPMTASDMALVVSGTHMAEPALDTAKNISNADNIALNELRDALARAAAKIDALLAK